MTFAEYLAAEAASDVKHEYLRGEIFDMAGGTPEHGRLIFREWTAIMADRDGSVTAVYSMR